MSWEEFKEMFEEKYMPAAGRTRLYQDFLNLKQGNMSIAEYETKFNELSCYGPGLIDSPLKKNEMFVQGLRPEYHERMTAHLKGSFVELTDTALRYVDLMNKRSVAQVAASGGNSSNPNRRKFNPYWKRQNKKKSGNNN